MGMPLSRYAQLIGYTECAFFGVRNDVDDPKYACRDIWTAEERENAENYLTEAQELIESSVLEFPLYPTCILNEEIPFYSYKSVKTAKSKIIDVGIQALADVLLAAPVLHATDPATITFPSTVDIDEIVVFYPGTDLEVNPSAVTSSLGNITISIPRCRLVKYSLLDTPALGLDYNDLTNFQDTMDVKRSYIDHSTQAVLKWLGTSSVSSNCSCPNCDTTSHTACEIVRNADIGTMDIHPATWNAESEKMVADGCNCCYGYPDVLYLNYIAGLSQITRSAESMIIRLAHSLMPTEPCGCDVTQRLWKRDRNIPQVLTAERLNCPFGPSDGAWMAWTMANDMKDFRMTNLVSRR